MAENGTSQTGASASQPSELETLRNIVFGAAKADLDNHLKSLEKTMQLQFEKTEQALNKQLESLQAKFDSGIEQLEQKLALADRQHEEREAELSAFSEKLASELEMSDSNSRQEADELHARMDKEIRNLKADLDSQIRDTLNRLSELTDQLSNQKTDRAALAGLLNQMAEGLMKESPAQQPKAVRKQK